VAQIVGLVDVYEAVTTERAYQQARSVTEAVETLRDHVRRGWRRHDITECFVDLISSGTLGNLTADVPVSWGDPTATGFGLGRGLITVLVVSRETTSRASRASTASTDIKQRNPRNPACEIPSSIL
jgi:hypothetical protein